MYAIKQGCSNFSQIDMFTFFIIIYNDYLGKRHVHYVKELNTYLVIL